MELQKSLLRICASALLVPQDTGLHAGLEIYPYKPASIDMQMNWEQAVVLGRKTFLAMEAGGFGELTIEAIRPA